MTRVLLVVDNPHREMRGMVAIWQRLRRRGIAVHIASKTNFNDWYAILRPDVVVLPRASTEMKWFMDRVGSEAKFVVIPSEHGLGFREKVLNNAFGPTYSSRGEVTTAIEAAALILVGGDNQKKWLEDARPELRGRIRVVGTLNTDHWFKAKTPRRSDASVGFSTTFKSVFLTIAPTYPHALLYEHLRSDHAGLRWRIDIQSFELRYLAVVFEAVDALVARGFQVDIRPHPHEYWPGWQRWRRLAPPGVRLNREIDISRWIDSNVACVTSFSTTSIDCIARGVPSITLEDMVASAADMVPTQKAPWRAGFSWRARSLDELFDLLERARRGDLPPSPADAEAREFMAANFHWPRQRTAASLCADAIAELASQPRPRRRRGLRAYAFVPVALLKIIAKDVRDFLGPRRSNLLYTFSFKLWRDAYRFNRDLVD